MNRIVKSKKASDIVGLDIDNLIVYVVISSVFLFLPSWTVQNVAPAQTANLNGEMKNVDVAKLQELAEKGDSNAQVQLGRRYEYGSGVVLDWQEAFSWYEKAANQGNAEGLFHLGYCYLHGIGVAIDLKTAADWLQKAIDQGNYDAMGATALLLMKGYSPDKDLFVPTEEIDKDRVLKLAREAAAKDNPEAIFVFEKMTNPTAFSRKDSAAYARLKAVLTAKRYEGNAVAEHLLAQLYTIDRGAEEQMALLLKSSADKGLAEAQKQLGVYYYNKKEWYYDATQLYQLAATQNYLPAFTELGKCYSSEVKFFANMKNADKAVDYALKGAEKQEGAALYALALEYQKRNEDSDYRRAFECFDLASRRGIADATYWKGLCLVEGRAVEKDLDAGYKLIIEAFDNDSSEAQKYVNNVERQIKDSDYSDRFTPREDVVRFQNLVNEHVNNLAKEGKYEVAKKWPGWEHQQLVNAFVDAQFVTGNEMGGERPTPVGGGSGYPQSGAYSQGGYAPPQTIGDAVRSEAEARARDAARRAVGRLRSQIGF